MILSKYLVYCVLGVTVICGQAFGWGADGHHKVGAVADTMIASSNAAAQVKAILGDLSLRDASVWADCAKGVVSGNGYEYRPQYHYPECKVYETSAGQSEMSDFVRRNDTNCDRKPDEESCHKLYHYTDVAIQHDHYAPGFVGTRNCDVVNALAATIRVLKGEPSPAPFSFKDKREALLALAHYVGDIHQPLHVGAVYLDLKGSLVNPDAGAYDKKTDTRGGNLILVNGEEKRTLHAAWDGIPAALNASRMDAAFLEKARRIPVTSGQYIDWPRAWAGDTLTAAGEAFQGLRFGKKEKGVWPVTLPPTYPDSMDRIKEKQLIKAGARLAQLLQAIWP